MSDIPVRIIVEAVDKASSALGGIGSALSTLGGIAAGVALGGVAAFGAAMVKGVGDAREAAQIYAQTQAVITSTGGAAGVSAQHVAEYASSLSAAAGKSLFGDDQIQQSTNMLLTFTNIKGEVLDLATAMTVDMGQALHKTPEDMSIMIGKLLNSSDAMSAAQRMGVSFTDQQLKLGKAMFESGNIAGYQKLVLDELNKEFGGSAEAAAKADGGWAQFKDRMGEAAETAGGALLPVLNRLFNFLNSTIAPTIERAAAAFANIIPVLAEVASQAYQWGVGLAHQYAAGIASAASAVVRVIQQLGSIIAGWLRPHSPPALLPEIDEWGKKTAEVWLDGFGQADLSGVQNLGESVQGVLRGLASHGQFDEAGIIPAVLGSERAMADAIANADEFGNVSEDALQKIVNAAGPAGPEIGGLVRNFFDLRKATEDVQRAQADLNRVTQEYADRLSPLNAELQQIQDQKHAIEDQIRIKKLQEEINDGKTDELTRQKDLLEIQEIQKRQQIDAVERERDVATDAAKQKVDAAEENKKAVEDQGRGLQASLSLYNQQNNLIGEQVNLLKQMQKAAEDAAKAAAGGGGGGGGAMPAITAPDISSLTQPAQQMGLAMADVKQRAAEMRAAVTDTFNNIIGKGREVIEFVLEFAPTFQILRGVVEAAIPPVKDIVLTTFGIISGFMREHGATMLADVTQVWQGIQSLINAVLPPIQAIVGAIFGAIATFLHTHGADIQAFLGQTWDQIASIVKIAVELIKAIIVPIFTFIASFLTSHSSEIQTILGNSWNAIKAIIDGALTLIKGVLTAALQAIKGDWAGAWETIKGTLSRVWEDIKTVLKSAWGNIKTMFGGFVNDALSMGRNIINGIIDGVKSGVGALVDAVKNAARKALDEAKHFLGISSPSRVFYEEIGLPIIQGATKGVKDNEGVFSDALKGVFGAGGILGSMGSAAAEEAKRIGLSSDYIEHQTEAIKAEQQQLSYLQQQAKLVDLIKDNGLDAKAILGDIKLGLNADPAAILEAMKNALAGVVQKAGDAFNVPAFASGVRGFAGGLALVGERGPELVGLPRGSNVFGNDELRAMGSTTQNIFQPGAIVVYGVAGQNADQLADRVFDRMQNRITARRTS